jgi:hypothetical protein
MGFEGIADKQSELIQKIIRNWDKSDEYHKGVIQKLEREIKEVRSENRRLRDIVISYGGKIERLV